MVVDRFAWPNYMKYLACLDRVHRIEVEVDSCWYKGLTSNSSHRQYFAIVEKPKEGRM